MLYLNNPNSRLSLPSLEEDDYETGILEEFGKGVSSGVDQLQGLIGGGGRALIGSALGDDDLFYDGMRYFDEQMAEAAENAADVGSLEEIDGIGDFAKYSAFVVGNVIPSLIGGGGTGAVGGYAAKRLAMHQAGKALVKQSAGQLSKKQAATQYARSTVGQEALAKRGLRGQMGGAMLFGTAAGAGESFTRIFDETGEEAAVEAIITGVASGALDAMAPMRALKRILPQKTFRDATEEVAGNIAKNRSVYRRALSEAGKTGATEGVTEMMQEIVQNATLEVVRGYDAELEDSFLERMFDDAKLSQYANAFVAGTIGGAAMGGATGALTRDPESRESIVRQEQLPSPEDVDRSQEEAESAEQVEEQAPTEQPQETFEERRKAVRQKAQGLPQRRREIPTANPEETRGGLQQDIIDKSLPQRRSSTPEQATVSRESIQARIQAQVDAMPAARDNAKRILKEVTQGQGRQGTYRNDGAGERVVITPPSPPVSTTEVSGALPDPAATTPPMKDLVGQDVEYNGNKGLLIEKDDGYYVATQDNGDVLIESGLNKSPAELGVVPVSGDLEFENDFEIDRKTKKFNLRGEEFTLTRIVRDADGNALSLAVRDGKGKRKTIRTKSVVQRADAQMTPPPDFSQIQVEMDDLPPAVQKMVINQSDPENIPDEVPAQEAIDIAQTIDEDTAEKVTQIASNRITIGATAEKYDSAQKFTGTIRDSKVTKLSEAIAEVNASQDAGRTAIDEARIRSLLDVEDHVMQDGTTVSGAGIAESGRYADQVGVALVDLFEAGMPKAFLRSVTGIRVHSGIENPDLGSSDGGYSTKSGFVTISKDLLNDAEKASETGSGTDANLRFVMAHELGHAYDVATAHSDNSPEFMLEMDGISPDNVTLDMGEVMHELASNYQSGTELGREMAYPFGYSFDWIMNSESGKAEQMLEVIRREAFAQSFAVFHSSPELLEQQAPLTYNYMKNILQTAPVEGRSNAENNTDTQEDVTSAEGVRGDVQPSSQPRDPEVQDGTGDRGDGGSSVDARQASEGVGDQTQQEDGDNTGQPVQLERTPVVLKATDKKPTFKKALNWEDTGNYIVTFADGDRYTLHFDDYSKEAGDEVYFTSEDGKVTAIGGMLGETKEETITELQQHRQKLIDAGENSYNLPLDPDVGSETREKALDIILDHPEGKIKLTDLRKKFRKLEDNQFDQMIKDLTDVPDATPEDIYVVEDGVISHPLTVQEIEEERLAEERMIAEEAEFEDDLQGLMDNDIPIDDFLFAPFTRVPEPDENAPVLPMGKVEQSLADLLAKNPNPTAEQLGEIVGAPKKRKGKESVEDVDVRPVTLDELRRYIRESLSESDNLKWYDEFGRFFRDLVGDANLDEASVIFGVTSAQNSAENNLSETLHIMALARKFDPVKQRKQFELAVKETPRSGGRKLMITGAQIKAIADLYAEGNFAGGIKTTTYMQMVQDRGRNEYNPFSVQDVHMSRVFGFRRKDYKKNKDGSKGALLDASKISSENEYRYAQYLTSVLADEFGMSPNQMQATLWFYAKQNLSPLVDSGRKGGDGTLASAVKYSEREIDVIRDMIDSGTFDTNSSVSEALSEGVRPSNKPTQKNTPFSNVNEREQLMGVARARSPKLIASAVAGKGRGLAFPDDTPIETLIQYNQDVMAAIVDDGGQIPILRELGIPHEIAESAGSYTGYEPSIIIRLLGGTMQTADKLAPLIGDALLQDAVITSQAVYGKEGLPSFMIRKTDRSEFTREEAMALAERVNPDKNPDGLNFNQPMADTLTFLDPRSLSDDTYTDSQAKEFAGILINTLGDEYTMSVATTEGNYHGSDQYREAIERAWNPDGAEGRPDIYDRTNDSLYEPVRKVYNEYAEKLGIPKREAQDLDFLNSPPTNVTDLNARREKKNLEEFRSKFMGEVRSRVEQNRELTLASKADGFFGNFDKGTRYITSYDRDGKTVQFKNEVVGISMSTVDRYDREGGKLNPLGPIPEDQIIEGADGKQYYANLYVKSVNPDGEEYQTTAAVYKLEKLAKDGQLQIMGGLRAVDDFLNSPPSKPVGKPNTNAIPEVNAAYQKFKAGEISQQDFDTVVLSTISEYDFVPTPATYDEMFGALNKNKKQKINIDIQDGEVVGLRLDIPAYTDHGVWVPTIHGDKTSHRATASITGVKFGDDKQPAKAQKVMEGGHKSPFAQMRGAFVNRTDAENEALAREALNDPDWIQIGFDPRRHSYFYDRKTGQPIVSAEEVIQVGPLVLAKNASSEGKTSSDFLFSPPSPTYDEVNAARNAQIREEKKKVDKASGWLKTTFKRQLTSRGLLNEQVFQAKVARDGEFGAAEIDTRMYLNSYDRAVKEANLSEYQTGLLSQAIGTPLDKLNNLDLPDAVKQAIGNMRKYLDKMSIDYAQVVADQAQELAKSGRGEAAVAKVDLLNTIVANKGKYLNRSFQVFDDPKWANKVPKPVIDNARTFLESNGAQNADRIINTILKTGTAFDGLTSFISEGKLGSKDLSILKKRKDIAPEILALMGEYTDPRINFVKTSTKLSRLLFNHRFLEEVKLKGEQDGFLFTADNAPTEAYVQIAPDSSDAMNPLNGLYTTPELAQGFKDVMDLGSEEGFWRAYRQLNSMVKYGKTVIAPTTMARNFMSASLFTVANGHFNWGKAGQSLRSLDGYFSSKEGDATAYLREIKRLGVVYDSPYAGELTKALEDFSNASELDSRVAVADGVGGKVKKGLASGTNFFAKFYQYGDDFWKIIGFENMVDVLMDNKGLTREQAMPLAAERIRDTYPTYSLIGKGVQELRKFPLVGTFVSFPAEIIRTSFNMFRYLKQDMADPDMRSHAMAKIAGMSAVSFGIYALQDAALRAFDVDEEEEEAIRLMSPSWSENSNILPTGRDEDGNLEYIDLTYLDPYAYFKKPINALLRDQPTDDAVVQAGKELLVPFFGVDILTGSILEILDNEKLSGGRIYNPADTGLNISSDIAQHFIKSSGPAVIQNINRTAKAINGDVSKSGKRYEVDDELKAWVGFRVTTFDPKIALHFKAYEFNEDKRNATSLLTTTFRDPNELDVGELENAFERASVARKEGYERMIKLVSAARSSGLNNTQLMMVLRSNGVTKKDARAMIAGNPAAWEMSDSTLKNSVKKSDLLFGEKTTKAYQDRWKVIQQLLLEETP